MTKNNGVFGEIWVLIGGRYTGKTTHMLKMTKNIPNDRLFFNEFHGSTWKDARRINRPYKPNDEFVEDCCKAKDSIFIFEDATALFRSVATNRMIFAMARSRDEGVTILLTFHSFRKTPDDILDMIDGMIIFKTRDQIADIKHKSDDPRVSQAWQEVQASNDPHAKKKVQFIYHHK